MGLSRLFARNKWRSAARRLYLAVVAQARQPAFYAEFGVPDAVMGRFDMIVLHAFLVMRRLKGGGDEASALSQALFDVMFEDLDRNLREMGVGDMSVGKKVKALARGFYGRTVAYDRALEGDEAASLEAALARNLYGAAEPGDWLLAAVANYVRREAAALESCPVAALLEGRVDFGPPPARPPAAGR